MISYSCQSYIVVGSEKKNITNVCVSFWLDTFCFSLRSALSCGGANPFLYRPACRTASSFYTFSEVYCLSLPSALFLFFMK